MKPTCDPRCNPVQIHAIGPGWTGHVAACKYFGTGKRGKPAPRKKPAKGVRWTVVHRWAGGSPSKILFGGREALVLSGELGENERADELADLLNGAGLVLTTRKR